MDNELLFRDFALMKQLSLIKAISSLRVIKEHNYSDFKQYWY